jgi:hypothetical protein
VTRLDNQSRARLLEGLIVLFYVALGLALLTTLMGSPGWGFLFLLLGSSALVVRTSIETLQRSQGGNSKGPPPSHNR